ncbi:unnamed protein product [Parascedosporium putredinis]|uniref:Ribosomal RNA-processing protein 7 C-terminal domain-containing protein n=1 Tax=Parascedosporium putredinis TaxID=1442378 RepID=A0A9P1H385_9PEZI|nr:unnamed protein product [Parascedosporium putredinis]CAI7995648.1 unnamed protein product [Parascedosporium putredinis]
MANLAPADSPEESFHILKIAIQPTASYNVPTHHELRLRRNRPANPTAADARSLFLKTYPPTPPRPISARYSPPRRRGPLRVGQFPDEGGRTAATATSTRATARGIVTLDPAAAVKMAGMGRKRKRADEEAAEARRELEARLPEIWTRKLHRSGATAVALLADEKSVQLVLKAVAKTARTQKYPVWGEGVPTGAPSLGAPWLQAHLTLTRADKVETQRAVHAFFEAYNARENEAAEAAKRLRNEPDEDGFVTVTRGGRTAPATQSSAEEARAKMLEKEARKKEEMKGFYRFQLREMRKDEQSKMLRRFQEDRKRVESMKEKRGRFKPET